MATTKLVVEVVEARNLLPKDGVGTSSPYAVVDFDGQRRRTRTVPRDLNPVWNETLEFAAGGVGEPLEVDVYHDRRVGPSRRSNFLGRLRLDSRQFVGRGEEALMHFPLQKKSFFGWVRGDVGLRIYFAEAEKSPEVSATPETATEHGGDMTRGDMSKQPPAEASNGLAAGAAATTTDVVALPPPDTSPAPTPKRLTQHPRPLLLPAATPDSPPTETERCTFDLVEKVPYLFVRILCARCLPVGSNPCVGITLHGRQVSTGPPPVAALPEWDRTFAFPFSPSAAAVPLEISVHDYGTPEQLHGSLRFDAAEAPVRDPPDSPLAAQWHRLEGGRSRKGELMFATWLGTQADESFHDACIVNGTVEPKVNSRSKVYLSPKLWYLRVSVLEAQDLPPIPATRPVSLRATLGFQVLSTRPAATWNEDLLFVVAEPFGERTLELSLVRSPDGKEEKTVVGTARIALSAVERRVDDRHVASSWISVDPLGRLHVRVCLDGGYNVADEPPHAVSDYRPSARQLWRRPVGTLEIGILGCRGLLPTRTVDGKGTADAYVVAKYGPKWARTRTLPGTLDPSWNEQYTWEVHDVATVITIAVLDESSARPLGRVRIRVSSLDDRRSHRATYPLLLPLASGVKKMGDLEVAARFTTTVAAAELLCLYFRPTHPAMHRIPEAWRLTLRLAAARLVAARLARAEPPLRREAVAYVLEAEAPPRFGYRKVRANWKRLVSCLSWVDDVAIWARDTARWRNPTGTVMAHVVLVLLACFPSLVVPSASLHVAGMLMWRYRSRPRGPGAPRTEPATAEEMEEELDITPEGYEALRARYERLRAVGARLQEMVGDVATQVERVGALLTWRDPRATWIFATACVFASLLLFLVPTKAVVIGLGFYLLRHPILREGSDRPAVLSFFQRLPSLQERYV